MNPSFLEQFVKYKTSPNVALVCGNTSLTYAELYNRSAALAARLRLSGVGVDSTAPECYDIFNPKAARRSPWVVIISERSVEAIIGVIATFMAGGAYVLMGSDAPDSYVDSILDDTAAAVVLRNGDFDAPEENVEFTHTFPQENEIACAIFTSGSTGKPKGAVLEHRVINEMIRWQNEYMNPAKWTATAAYAPLSFIATLSEFFLPLANGLALHILDEDTRHDLFTLENYIENNNISYLFLPPNIAEIFTQTYRGSSLKYLRVAGGRLKSCGDPGGRYEIMYSLGMSENGGSVTFNPIRKAMNENIVIGKAWNKTQVYLVGGTNEIGEMAVSGPSLFRGYLSREEETLTKRVKNPYSDQPGYEMMYLSGDLAQFNENGELIHKGRNDWIVKIRDMKVDPMHVENVLGACAGVVECCVTAQVFDDENVLIGWVVGGTGTETLRTELAARLPEYMIPSVFVALDNLPRNLNGKIDRGLLAYEREESKSPSHSGMDECRDMNNNESEAKFAELFKRVLGSSPGFVGAEDNFFKLGGNSLKLMQLQVEIARKFSRNIPYTVLFANPTPRMLAAVLQNQTDAICAHIPPAKPREAYPLSAPMRQMWLLWRTGQDRGKYTMSINCRVAGEIDKSRLKSSFEELLRRNDILRSRFEERGGEVFQIVEEVLEVSVGGYPRREFDLSAAPIFDISLNENVLTFTTHHIIADAMGMRMLMEDFWKIYGGGEPPESVQTHDITMWSLDKKITATAADETFWRQMFPDKAPLLKLPYDFARPARLNSSAREAVFFDKNETARLHEYASSHNATLLQLFLTAYALLLSKLSGGESVVIGVPFAGRNHPDMARTIGMFVRTLPIKLDISGMEFCDALKYTRKQFLEVWEHQDISLERLTEIIDFPRVMSRNPFYDVMINYIPLPQPLPDVCGLRPEILRGEYPAALFDLVLDLREETDGVSAVFTYADELFKPATICCWAEAFKKLLLEYELNLDQANFKTPVNEKENENEKKYDAAEFDENSPQACALLQTWKNVLEKENVLPDDDFFAAGGTSLAAIRMEAALFEKGWLLSAADIFQNPRLCDVVALMSLADEIDWESEE